MQFYLPDNAFSSTAAVASGSSQSQLQKQQQQQQPQQQPLQQQQQPLQQQIFLNVQQNLDGSQVAGQANSFILGTISNFSR